MRPIFVPDLRAVAHHEGQAMTGRARRAQICGVIVAVTAEQGYAPTIRELAERLGVSPSCVALQLDTMRARGEVMWEEGRGRTLRVVPRAAE